jgi:hypothetical protein
VTIIKPNCCVTGTTTEWVVVDVSGLARMITQEPVLVFGIYNVVFLNHWHIVVKVFIAALLEEGWNAYGLG